ncbi:hypothetical protein [Cytobacillus oceanisediminis]|uniref:hypothetical protein n=1 Tax=Cytobacillus oceanisediminis TaxID=665099 RepID=UPI001C215CE4|nr:hypothetical protein [Cytobacillus oceanisediminis]MBU8770295.1 hypothetical protein [Cytobacillus oceanisediminis]
MQPLRAKLYSQIEQQGTYSIDTLSRQYGLSKPVIQVQLQKMKEEGKQIEITDDEVSVFIDHTRPIWIILPYIFMGFFLALALGGYING